MTLARSAPQRRRTPPPADRYRATARAAKLRHARRRLPFIAQGIAAAVFLLLAFVITNQASATVSGAVSGVGQWASTLFPAAVAPSQLTITEGGGAVGPAPILEAMPQFTKTPALLVQGVVPAFGLAADRKIEVTLNGGTGITAPIDANGHFAVPLVLKEGPNSIVVAVVAPNEVIASSARTVVLDRTPPPLTLTKPKAGDTLDGPNVTVEGKAEPSAVVLVNDRSVIVAADGSFSDTFTVQAGDLALTVIARDRAGNETKAELSVAVKEAAKAGTAALTVTLNKTAVKPGEVVRASIFLTNESRPQADASVSLQVGVIHIASAKTDASGHAQISFAAPPNEGVAQVVVLGPNVSASATLVVAR